MIQKKKVRKIVHFVRWLAVEISKSGFEYEKSEKREQRSENIERNIEKIITFSNKILLMLKSNNLTNYITTFYDFFKFLKNHAHFHKIS